MRTRYAVVALAALIVPAASHAQNQYLGPDIGVYYPTSATLKAALGDQWWSFGLSATKSGTNQKAMGPSFNGVSQTKNGNRALMLSYSYGLFQPMGGGGRRGGNDGIIPFFALRAGASYIDYRIGTASGSKFGYNANAEVGVIFSDRMTLSARYDIFSAHDGLRFDGFSINLRYGLVGF